MGLPSLHTINQVPASNLIWSKSYPYFFFKSWMKNVCGLPLQNQLCMFPFLMCLDQLLIQYLHDLLSIVFSIDFFYFIFNSKCKSGVVFSLFLFSRVIFRYIDIWVDIYAFIGFILPWSIIVIVMIKSIWCQYIAWYNNLYYN